MNVREAGHDASYREVLDRLRREREPAAPADRPDPRAAVAFGHRQLREEGTTLLRLVAGGAERQTVRAERAAGDGDEDGSPWVMAGPPVRRPDKTLQLFIDTLVRHYRLDGIRIEDVGGWIDTGGHMQALRYAAVVSWLAEMIDGLDRISLADHLERIRLRPSRRSPILTPNPEEVALAWRRDVSPVLGLILVAGEVEPELVARLAQRDDAWPASLTFEWLVTFFRSAHHTVALLGGTRSDG